MMKWGSCFCTRPHNGKGGGSCFVRGKGMWGNMFRADVFLLTISIDVFIINMIRFIM